MITRIQATGLPLVIIDNHSLDGTLEKALEMGIEVFQRTEFGSGYGCGIQKALKVAAEKGYEYVGIMDCDSTYAPEEFLELRQKLPEYDLVVGARPMNSIGFLHRMANLIHIYAGRILFSHQIMDINSGMRLIRVSLFHGRVDAYNMGMVAQMTSLALRNKLKFIEMPISYGKRLGSSKIRIWDTTVILWHILNERFKSKINSLP